MTANQINYWSLQERKVNNERERAEDYRSNRAKEMYNLLVLGEDTRSHKVNEAIATRNAESNARNAASNERNASTNARNAEINASNAYTNWYNARINERNAVVNERNAATNARKASIDEYNASINAMNAQTRLLELNELETYHKEQVKYNYFKTQSDLDIALLNVATSRYGMDKNYNASTYSTDTNAAVNEAKINQSDTESKRSTWAPFALGLGSAAAGFAGAWFRGMGASKAKDSGSKSGTVPNVTVNDPARGSHYGGATSNIMTQRGRELWKLHMYGADDRSGGPLSEIDFIAQWMK